MEEKVITDEEFKQMVENSRINRWNAARHRLVMDGFTEQNLNDIELSFWFCDITQEMRTKLFSLEKVSSRPTFDEITLQRFKFLEERIRILESRVEDLENPEED